MKNLVIPILAPLTRFASSLGQTHLQTPLCLDLVLRRPSHLVSHPKPLLISTFPAAGFLVKACQDGTTADSTGFLLTTRKSIASLRTKDLA
ncbi:MAG: hypothetical protein UY79_C0007G0010 [Parcubacteria group bacterium GW2011_GWA2_53_21]|nr:MAG: hypothetical protein UY79_C0007G0010 [Parcubacteria group bacterium GW2011_GWA2_53_21]